MTYNQCSLSSFRASDGDMKYSDLKKKVLLVRTEMNRNRQIEFLYRNPFVGRQNELNEDQWNKWSDKYLVRDSYYQSVN